MLTVTGARADLYSQSQAASILGLERKNVRVAVLALRLTYKVDPMRVIASGHSQYDPVQNNSSPEGRALNRRTDIFLSPKLDELYRLLQTPDM